MWKSVSGVLFFVANGEKEEVMEGGGGVFEVFRPAASLTRRRMKRMKMMKRRME